MKCLCGHAEDEHGADPEFAGSTACDVQLCGCLEYGAEETVGDEPKVTSPDMFDAPPAPVVVEAPKEEEPVTAKAKQVRKCTGCGEAGHYSKTCPKGPKAVIEGAEPVVKHPRGRPKKVVVEGAEPVIKRPRGRPRKVVVEGEAPVVKRKPGRPPKVVVEGEAPVVKKKPGRPKSDMVKVNIPRALADALLAALKG